MNQVQPFQFGYLIPSARFRLCGNCAELRGPRPLHIFGDSYDFESRFGLAQTVNEFSRARQGRIHNQQVEAELQFTEQSLSVRNASCRKGGKSRLIQRSAQPENKPQIVIDDENRLLAAIHFALLPSHSTRFQPKGEAIRQPEQQSFILQVLNVWRASEDQTRSTEKPDFIPIFPTDASALLA